MLFRLMNSKKLFTMGLLFLAIANVWHWFAQREQFSDKWADGLFGLLMGVGIGMLLIYLGRRRRHDGSTLQA